MKNFKLDRQIVFNGVKMEEGTVVDSSIFGARLLPYGKHTEEAITHHFTEQGLEAVNTQPTTPEEKSTDPETPTDTETPTESKKKSKK